MGLDPSVVEKFHFTREMIEGPVYRKYEKAIRKFWSVEDLDFTQDVRAWETIDEDQRRGLLGVTVRFLAGEQNVTNELVPMLAAAQALRRFDWTVYLSTFLMEEAKHAEFFMRWHKEVVGVLEPEEVAQHFLVRGKTIDPSGRFEVRDVLHEALPYYGRRLLETTLDGNEAEIERAFVAFSAACNVLIEKDPSYEEEVHRVFDAYRGNIVGLVEYQKAVPGLDLGKYQVMKVRHYRNRCREMGITPDETLIEQIVDPTIDFVVGVEAG